MKFIHSLQFLVPKVIFFKSRNDLYRTLAHSKLYNTIFKDQLDLSKNYNQLLITEKRSLHENKMSISKLGVSETYSTFVKGEISRNKVVIFSKTTCPFCTKIKEKFKSAQLTFKAIELDLMGKDGVEIQNTLYEKTKQKTVPNIFINGIHVGGCDSTMKLFDNGEIFQLLADTITHEPNVLDPAAFVNSQIANNDVVIFSKTYCPFCSKAKDKFNSINQTFKAIELDLLGEDGVQIQNALLEKSGQKTVPNIFINGKHIGGCDATLKLFETGEISNVLSKLKTPTFNAAALINDEIKENKIMIFSKTTCPYCTTAKEKFKSINQEFKTIELDLLGEQGVQIQNALFEKSGQKTVPNIFINCKHIGGCDAILKLFQDGSIKKLLDTNLSSGSSSSSKTTDVEQILKNNKLVVFGQVDDNLKQKLKFHNYTNENLTDELKQELYFRSGKKLYSYIFYNQQQVTVDELNSIDSTFIKIDEYINNNKVIIYSKTHCPFCKQAKALFTESDYNFQVVELDTLSNGAQIQEALFEKTGQKTVPNIFINGKHIGGCSDLLDTYYDGRFYDYMDNNFETYDYDLCVIGGGSGGISAAKEAASMNKKVALFDYVTPSQHGTIWGLGGTCVNVGCIPKKLFHKASLLNEEASTSDKFGFGIEKSFSWKSLVDNVQKYISNLNNNYEQELQKNKIDYFNAKAVFVDKHRVKFSGQERTLSAQNFIIAVGGRPTYPDIPGAYLGITSDDLFSLNRDPGKVLLVGASYIALECAGFLNGLGYDTTVMVRSILLRGFDQDIANMIGEDLASRGVKFIRSHVPTELIKRDERNILVKAEDTNSKEKYEGLYNTVVFAIGRTACTENLNLNNINISVQPNKKLDASHEKTKVHSVYAVGDVINNAPELTPVAIKAGKLLVKRIYRKTTENMNYKLVPTTVFTPLEYGSVGYSETDAKATLKNVVVYHNQFVPLENALEDEPRKCYAKLVCDADNNDKVIGLHVLGPNAGEITQGFSLGIMMGASKKDFDALIGIHPTCAEVFTTMNVSKESNKKLESSGC